MSAVVLIAKATERDYNIYTVETSDGPYVIIFLSRSRLDRMIAILSWKFRGQNVRLSHLDIPFANLNDSITYIKDLASPINARFVDDSDPLVERLLSGTRQLPSFNFWKGVEER